MRKMCVVFLVACVAVWMNVAQGAELQLHHLMDARFFYQDLRQTKLTPVPDWIGVENNRAVYTYRLDLSEPIGQAQVKGTLSLGWNTASDRKSGLSIDTLFTEFSLSDRAYAFIGRRHFVYGTSYGLNPADVFLDVLEEDRTKNETRRRIETQGIDAVGGEFFASDRLAVLGFVAPEWEPLNKGKGLRAGMSATLLVPEKNTDLAFLLFEDARPGGAWSVSRTMGDAWVLYMDTSFRQNRSRALPKKGLVPGRFTLVSKKNGKTYFSGTVGMGLTFTTGTTFNLEYSYQGDGYNTEEWRDIKELIDANAKEWKNGPEHELGRGGLLILSRALRSLTLRQNYLFGRIFSPDLFNFRSTSLEGTVLHNLDDGSGVFSLRTETEVGRNTLLGLYASVPYGESDSEFGLRVGGLLSGGYVTVTF